MPRGKGRAVQSIPRGGWKAEGGTAYHAYPGGALDEVLEHARDTIERMDDVHDDEGNLVAVTYVMRERGTILVKRTPPPLPDAPCPLCGRSP